jgi:hypothetical protein
MPLHFKTSSIDVEVKLKPVGNEIMVPKPAIKMRLEGEPLEKVRIVASKRYLWMGKGKALACETRFIDPESEKQVPSSEVIEVLDHYNYKILDSKVNVVDEKENADFIEYYYVDENGEEKVVRPFERTKVIDIPEENWVPSTIVDQFLITSIYELYTDNKADIAKLWEEAEKRLKEDVVGIATYSHGRGFIQYYAFLVPVVQSGKFVWLLKLTDTKVQLRYLQDIPAEVKVPVKEAPTLETLPPVQLVVATSKKKKAQR